MREQLYSHEHDNPPFTQHVEQAHTNNSMQSELRRIPRRICALAAIALQDHREPQNRHQTHEIDQSEFMKVFDKLNFQIKSHSKKENEAEWKPEKQTKKKTTTPAFPFSCWAFMISLMPYCLVRKILKRTSIRRIKK